MIGNIVVMGVIFAVAVLFFWLAIRAGRIRRGYMRWPSRILAGLLGLVFAVVFVVASIGYLRLETRVSRPAATEVVAGVNIPVTYSPDILAMGEQRIKLCTGCHSTAGTLPLDGSTMNFMDAGGPPFGVLYGPNLTPGGDLKNWSDDEIIRAIREGIGKDGRPLVVMPSVSFRYLSDEDVHSMVAALRAQPVVERSIPERNLSPLAALFLGAGLFPTSVQEPITAPVVEPPPGTAEYGKYITLAYGCEDCHGPDMGGMPSNGFIPGGPDAKLIVQGWGEEDFLRLFSDGRNPSGRLIDISVMPWHEYKQALNVDELRAVYRYLHGE